MFCFRNGQANIKGIVTLMGDNVCEAVSDLPRLLIERFLKKLNNIPGFGWPIDRPGPCFIWGECNFNMAYLSTTYIIGVKCKQGESLNI